MQVRTKFDQGDRVTVFRTDFWEKGKRGLTEGVIDKVKIYSQEDGDPRIYYTVRFKDGIREGYIESMIGQLPPWLRGKITETRKRTRTNR